MKLEKKRKAFLNEVISSDPVAHFHPKVKHINIYFQKEKKNIQKYSNLV